jgi:drug efflux transport system permease protein
MNFVWQRALAITKKEIYHVLRDPFTLALALGLPLFMVFIFGLAIEFNVKYIPLAVHDADKSQSSRRLIETFGSSDYFIIDPVRSDEIAQQGLDGDRYRAALLIPGGFEKDLFSGRSASIQVLLDGSDNSTVSPVLSYINDIQKIAIARLTDSAVPDLVDLKVRFLFNPELNSRWFVIPGLTVTVMAILSVLLTTLTVAREWENGSMELLLTTPVEPIEIIVGKLSPYALLGLLAVTFVYVISRIVFGIPFEGSLWVFGLGCLIFLVTYLAQGLLISVATRSQQIAMQFAMLTGLLPAQLLSGFIFPVESMPPFFQKLTMILPARWFMQIARASYLKGPTLLDMAIPFMALFFLCAVMIYFATRQFKKDIEP